MINEVREILKTTLQIGDRADELESTTPLLGNIPELDSMAVVMVVTPLEENFDFIVDDDDMNAETFETFGSLCEFVKENAA